MAPGPFAGPQAQQATREVNTASLCRIGQETVQDIVYRTMEIFQLLRNMQVRSGAPGTPERPLNVVGSLSLESRILDFDGLRHIDLFL